MIGEKRANAIAKWSDDICHSGLYLLLANDRLRGVTPLTVRFKGLFWPNIFKRNAHGLLGFGFFLIYIYIATQKTQGPLQPNHPPWQNGIDVVIQCRRQWCDVGSGAMPPNNPKTEVIFSVCQRRQERHRKEPTIAPENGFFHRCEMSPKNCAGMTPKRRPFWMPECPLERRPNGAWNDVANGSWMIPKMVLQMAPEVRLKWRCKWRLVWRLKWHLERTPAMPKKCRRSEQLFYWPIFIFCCFPPLGSFVCVLKSVLVKMKPQQGFDTNCNSFILHDHLKLRLNIYVSSIQFMPYF